MKAYIERSKVVHPYINAATDERYEDALKDAKNIDKFLASNVKSEEDIARDTPLLGVPFTCKEVIGVKGMKQNSGLVRHKDRVAEEDGAAPALYRKGGSHPSHGHGCPGIVTTGGSSGGEGAIIAAGGALFGIGNDIAGSIRIPSCFCGIYGHKPSKGIVPNWGSFPFCHIRYEHEDRTVEFVSTGPMCRYARDLPLLLRILSDNDPRIHLDEKVNFRNLKIYYIEEFPGTLLSAVPDVKKAIRKAAEHFEAEYGIKTTPSITGIEVRFQHLGIQTFGIRRTTILILLERRRQELELEFKNLEQKIKEIFEEDAIILVPTHPEPAPHYLMTIPMYPNIAYTCIFNILGLPSSQIPAGLSNGVPIGIQAVSGPFKDHISVATALELDKVFNGWISPFPINVQ
ncbi:fatty-acid amide hydrolase 2 [Trichonephila inaurata madagascariensis]|uniref:Fatty-acid amide hydrolase 2 n=1 Tax=Trichonephila inaurata madagascariensis TaxID=2747483 RepID=A0A8X6YIT9_9ARAC|nr:fatty-acid amide hydrolase 2 [Trichonephila inaurata madagascariensis]